MMTWDVLVQQWWVQVSSAIVAGLALAAIAAIFSEAVRNKFWKPIGRVIRWPFTIRFTTTYRQLTRQRADATFRENAILTGRRFEEVCELLDVWPLRKDSTVVVERIRGLQEAKEKAWADAREQIEAAQSLAEQQLSDQARRGAELAETAKELGRAEGRDEAMAEVEAKRAAPLLQPQWRIDDVEDSNIFMLTNTQPGVAVSDVSLSPLLSDFAFDSPSQWPGPMEKTITFHGERQGNGQAFGVRFVVGWQDANGDRKAGAVFLDKPTRKPIARTLPQVARRPPEPTNWT